MGKGVLGDLYDSYRVCKIMICELLEYANVPNSSKLDVGDLTRGSVEMDGDR
jgi:hypothetical protein